MSTNTIQWTERDVESAAQVLAMASADGTPLPTLTDEEVVALDGCSASRLSPHLGSPPKLLIEMPCAALH
ncbi:hypothetical protein ACX80E_03610 [Arthrobacter sp. TMN-49]